MAILGKLLGDGLEGAGESLVKKALKNITQEDGGSTLAKLGRKTIFNRGRCSEQKCR